MAVTIPIVTVGLVIPRPIPVSPTSFAKVKAGSVPDHARPPLDQNSIDRNGAGGSDKGRWSDRWRNI
jgi:hypothetical protein